MGKMVIDHVKLTLARCRKPSEGIVRLDINRNFGEGDTPQHMRYLAKIEVEQQLRDAFYPIQLVDVVASILRFSKSPDLYATALLDSFRSLSDDDSAAQKRHKVLAFGKEIARKSSQRFEVSATESIRLEPRLNQKEVSRMIKALKENEPLVMLANWISCSTTGNLGDMRTELAEALDRKADITIAILHPNSPSVFRRNRDLKANRTGDPKVRDQVLLALKNILDIFWEWRKLNPTADKLPNFRVMVHDCIPALQVYIFKNRAFVGFYFREKNASENLNLEIDMRQGMHNPPETFGDAIRAHVQSLLTAEHGRTPLDLRPLLEADAGVISDPAEQAALVDKIVADAFDGRPNSCQVVDLAELLANLGSTNDTGHTNEIVRRVADKTIERVMLKQEHGKRFRRLMRARANCAAIMAASYRQDVIHQQKLGDEDNRTLELILTELLDLSALKLNANVPLKQRICNLLTDT